MSTDDKQVGGEVDGAERQLDRPSDGQMGVSDSGSRSDEKNPKIHSDSGRGGVPEKNVSGTSVQNSRNPFRDLPGGAEVKTLTSNAGGGGSMPAQGANMLPCAEGHLDLI